MTKIEIVEAVWKDKVTYVIAITVNDEVRSVLQWIEPQMGPCWQTGQPALGWHSPYREQAEEGLEWLVNYYAKHPDKLNGAVIVRGEQQ